MSKSNGVPKNDLKPGIPDKHGFDSKSNRRSSAAENQASEREHGFDSESNRRSLGVDEEGLRECPHDVVDFDDALEERYCKDCGEVQEEDDYCPHVNRVVEESWSDYTFGHCNDCGFDFAEETPVESSGSNPSHTAAPSHGGGDTAIAACEATPCEICAKRQCANCLRHETWLVTCHVCHVALCSVCHVHNEELALCFTCADNAPSEVEIPW